MTDNPHIIIQSKGNGLADVEGIADCDDAILFCRAACDVMASPMDIENRQKFLSEMMVSVLRTTCGYDEGMTVLAKAQDLLQKNNSVLGSLEK